MNLQKKRNTLAIGIMLLTSFLTIMAKASAAPSKWGVVSRCDTSFQDVSYYEVKKITRCKIKMSGLTGAEYVNIRIPGTNTLAAQGKVIARTNSGAVIILTRNSPVRKGYIVTKSDTIPDVDREISRFTRYQ